MMNQRTIIPEATYLGTSSPSLSISGDRYRQERPPQYGAATTNSSPGRAPPTPLSTFRNASPKTASSSPSFQNLSPKTIDVTATFRSESPKANTSTTNSAFRNITSDALNHLAPSPRTTTPRGFLPLTSPAGQGHYGPSDEKLVTRLYGKIETQEAEFDRLKFQYEEERKRREQLEIDLAEKSEEIEATKRRFVDYKKQEREHRNKFELDKKERTREENGRWEATMEEMEQLRKDLKAKTQKLAEFEFLCLNLQQTLDNEKGKGKTELAEAEKRISLSSQMLETCHSQLSRADKQLKKERKMKQILIKINEALQVEIKRLQEEIVTIKHETEVQLSNSLSFQQSKESEDNTNQIIQDLQIEDALFYFEEVKRQYEGRPKVYREFLEVIRNYKGRTLSTPEVIARISKLFQGNSKLIIGFNRFLPKDFHINEEDVADMQGYNGAAPAPAKTSETTPAPGGTVPPPGATGDKTDKYDPAREQGKGKADSKKSKDIKHPATESKENQENVEPGESDDIKKESEKKSGQGKGKKSDTSDAQHKITKKNESGLNNKPTKEEEDEAKNSALPDVVAIASLAETASSLHRSLTINTSAQIDEESVARPPVKKPPGDLEDDDSDEDEMDTDTGSELASPTAADVASPKFDTFQTLNLSTAGSSQVFGGIESIDDSFGVGILSVDQSTLYMPSDRYDIIEDQEYTAIEMIADQRIRSSSYTRTSGSSSSSSYWNKL